MQPLSRNAKIIIGVVVGLVVVAVAVTLAVVFWPSKKKAKPTVTTTVSPSPTPIIYVEDGFKPKVTDQPLIPNTIDATIRSATSAGCAVSDDATKMVVSDGSGAVMFYLDQDSQAETQHRVNLATQLGSYLAPVGVTLNEAGDVAFIGTLDKTTFDTTVPNVLIVAHDDGNSFNYVGSLPSEAELPAADGYLLSTSRVVDVEASRLYVNFSKYAPALQGPGKVLIYSFDNANKSARPTYVGLLPLPTGFSEGKEPANFGAAMALSGNTLVVSSAENKVFIYSRTAVTANWTFTGEVLSTTRGDAGDNYFGITLSMSKDGRTLMIHNPFESYRVFYRRSSSISTDFAEISSLTLLTNTNPFGEGVLSNSNSTTWLDDEIMITNVFLKDGENYTNIQLLALRLTDGTSWTKVFSLDHPATLDTPTIDFFYPTIVQHPSLQVEDDQDPLVAYFYLWPFIRLRQGTVKRDMALVRIEQKLRLL